MFASVSYQNNTCHYEHVLHYTLSSKYPDLSVIRQVYCKFSCGRQFSSEISFRDEDRSTVLADKRVRIDQRQADRFDLGPRFAGADDQRNSLLPEEAESRPRRLERIGTVIEKGSVEVAEDDNLASHFFSRSLDEGRLASPNFRRKRLMLYLALTLAEESTMSQPESKIVDEIFDRRKI